MDFMASFSIFNLVNPEYRFISLKVFLDFFSLLFEFYPVNSTILPSDIRDTCLFNFSLSLSLSLSRSLYI